MQGIVGEFRSIKDTELLAKDDAPLPTTRVYRLCNGDEIVVNSVGFEKYFGMNIKDINLCDQHFDPNFICMEKIRRKKWWQFWKPKYVAVRLMYVDSNMEELYGENNGNVTTSV